jgi:hypothetical protein
MIVSAEILPRNMAMTSRKIAYVMCRYHCLQTRRVDFRHPVRRATQVPSPVGMSQHRAPRPSPPAAVTRREPGRSSFALLSKAPDQPARPLSDSIFCRAGIPRATDPESISPKHRHDTSFDFLQNSPILPN